MHIESYMGAYAKNTAPKAKKVLVVEDDPQWQMIISQTLKNLDRTTSVRCVTTAKQAQQLLSENSTYDLIISDHFLEGDTTGLQLWKECQEKDHGIPFLMISGMGQAELSGLFAKDAEPPQHVSKNLTMDTIRSALSWALGLQLGKFSITTEYFETALNKLGLVVGLTLAMILPSFVSFKEISDVKVESIAIALAKPTAAVTNK